MNLKNEKVLSFVAAVGFLGIALPALASGNIKKVNDNHSGAYTVESKNSETCNLSSVEKESKKTEKTSSNSESSKKATVYKVQGKEENGAYKLVPVEDSEKN